MTVKKSTTTQTFEDFALCGHFITAELKQTIQVTEVFDLPQHGKTLLQLPFEPAGVTLGNLRENNEQERS